MGNGAVGKVRWAARMIDKMLRFEWFSAIPFDNAVKTEAETYFQK